MYWTHLDKRLNTESNDYTQWYNSLTPATSVTARSSSKVDISTP